MVKSHDMRHLNTTKMGSFREFPSYWLSQRPVLKQHEGYLGTDLVILNRGQMTRTTPELASPSPNFRATPTRGRLATTYDLACNGPNTRRIFSGTGSRTCHPPVPRSRPYH
ncbi:hypothetical protein AVEN_89640-1 [Araneus ventricosus]|uniref:Uncharacterized protein n=1 Tax=Araneus ventricosus TaxID=182803 RepID=A0A4Y2ETR0_ARAVE|nr:hypothetical protein AVEN_89640-1 [Araneus ventricosus]